MLDLQDFQDTQADAARGCTDSRFALAKHYLNGSQYTEQNTLKGVELLTKAALANHVEATAALAELYRTGFTGFDGIVIEQDKPLAFSLFQGVLGYNVTVGEIGMARLYNDAEYASMINMSVETAKEHAKHYMEHASLNGSLLASYELGMMYKEENNIGLAQYMLVTAAKKGYSPAFKEVMSNPDIYN